MYIKRPIFGGGRVTTEFCEDDSLHFVVESRWSQSGVIIKKKPTDLIESAKHSLIKPCCGFYRTFAVSGFDKLGEYRLRGNFQTGIQVVDLSIIITRFGKVQISKLYDISLMHEEVSHT